MRPRIIQGDDQIGFYWSTPTGSPTSLQALVTVDDEPDRLMATHLEALDDALIIAAARFGEILGGGRLPADADEHDGLVELYRNLDRLCLEFATAQALTGWARGIEHPAEGIAIMEAALDQLDRNRAVARRPYYLSLLAETCTRLGDRDRAASVVETAVAMAESAADRWWLPVLYIQRGEFQPPPVRDDLHRRALDLARDQHSRTIEERIVHGTLWRTLRERQPS